MKLYLLENSCQTRVGYRSAVVLAKDEAEARQIHPDGINITYYDYNWEDPTKVNVTLLGTATKNLAKQFPSRVITSYFHEE